MTYGSILQKTATGSPWLPPGTASTWVCRCGGINPRTSTNCRRCRR
ncbi:hypothetical protein FHS43_000404 [Streptosporangium becharense]|uniref:RanBP2-type domain-containing protein n=1 Tax=Streptosporangium becharense TaxID=1816182 RepID=A0A7W9MGW4_9ACTN|nr:hypothetical protein [Streptosporangium becharense]MBB5819823.1 hypothetical protein [Streptosporangium becharense]